MGARLAAYYAEAEGLFGLDGKIQLAMLTRIPSTRALVEPDSPDNVHKFEGAIGALRRQRASVNTNHTPAPFHPSERVPAPHRAVADGEELFWGVLGALHDSMVGVFERDGRCLMVWESRSLEQRFSARAPDGAGPPSQPSEGSVGDLMARLVSSHFAAELRTVHDSGGSHQSELECSIRGQRTWLSVSLSAAHDGRGSVLGVHAFVQDITEQRRSEENLRRSEARLREHSRIYAELMAQRGELLDEVDESLRRITEVAARTQEVARAGVWFYDEDQTRLVCADRFDAREHVHAHGEELLAQDHLPLFQALRAPTPLAVQEARLDARTASLAESLLRPHDIASLLAAPIWAQGEVVGVLVFEHAGAPRQFMADEENFAHMLASFVALALQLRERSG
jgi:PAS domain-containing protein